MQIAIICILKNYSKIWYSNVVLLYLLHSPQLLLWRRLIAKEIQIVVSKDTTSWRLECSRLEQNNIYLQLQGDNCGKHVCGRKGLFSVSVRRWTEDLVSGWYTKWSILWVGCRKPSSSSSVLSREEPLMDVYSIAVWFWILLTFKHGRNLFELQAWPGMSGVLSTGREFCQFENNS